MKAYIISKLSVEGTLGKERAGGGSWIWREGKEEKALTGERAQSKHECP